MVNDNAVQASWIITEIERRIGHNKRVLDLGCGTGLLTNELATHHDVTGVDLLTSNLEAARMTDPTKSVEYIEANPYALPFANDQFDVVCAMDLLERVEAPECVLAEASRVLRPGGLFFFHTFNRSWLNYLWCRKSSYPLFIKPEELKERCWDYSMEVLELKGFAPNMLTRAFWKLVWRREATSDVPFRFSGSLRAGYCGIAYKIA